MKQYLYFIIFLISTTIYSADTLAVSDTSAIQLNDTIASDSTSLTSNYTNKDQVSKQAKIKAQKEKVLKDSIEFEEKKIATILRNTLEKGIMTIQPQLPDSIISYHEVLPHQVMQTDGLNFSDVLNKNPQFLPVLRNLTSSYNNSLFWGIPTPILTIRPNDELISAYPYRVPYNERISPKEIYAIKIRGNEIQAELFPQDFLVPHTSLLWEGGIRGFRSNMLNVRFTRPMTENIQLGIFTNYQHLNRKKYSHTVGDIDGFYKGIYDPLETPREFMSDTGTNPYTNEFIASAKMLYIAPKGSKVRFSYSYSDTRNDIPLSQLDTTNSTDTILWKEDINYIHRIKASVTELKLNDKLYIKSQLFLTNHKNRLSPIEYYDKWQYKGEKLSTGGGIKPYLLISENDIASIEFTAQRDATTRYNHQDYISQDIRLLGKYSKNYQLGKIAGNASLEAGGIFVKLNDKRENNPHLAFWGEAYLGNQRLSINAANTILPPQVTFDSENSITPGDLVDSYNSFGADLFLNKGCHSVLLGYKGVRSLKERSDSLYWSPGIMPYKTAGNNFILAPSFFTGKKVSLSSTWLFTDSKPYIKSKSSLLFHIHKDGRVQHTFLSFDLMYWSKRDKAEFAGVDKWNREVWDVNFHATVQIKTFRLYYKIDNILNRQNTFVPGFYLPGLTLRWGFNWQITG